MRGAQLDRYRTLAGILRDVGRPRGDTLEVVGVQYLVDPMDPLMRFKERRMSLDYVKRELQWYLDGDPNDDRIGEHAAIWRGIFDHDGWARSNYGAVTFADGGLKRAVDILRRDITSRKAVIYLGRQEWVNDTLADQPCTNSMQLLVTEGPRGGRTENPSGVFTLDLIVSMRSQDFIYGTANDAPFFSMVLLMAAAALDVLPGQVTMQVGSLHVYERHFDMCQAIAMGATPTNDIWPGWLISNQDAPLYMAGNWRITAWGSWLSTAKLGGSDA